MLIFSIFVGHIHIFETGLKLVYSGGYRRRILLKTKLMQLA